MLIMTGVLAVLREVAGEHIVYFSGTGLCQASLRASAPPFWKRTAA
jgi:hypothetical protein